MKLVLPAHYKNLRKGQVFTVGPSTIQSLMTGVLYMQQDRRGIVALTYVDGSVEKVSCPHVNLGDATREGFNFFSVVSAVQSHRGPDKETDLPILNEELP